MTLRNQQYVSINGSVKNYLYDIKKRSKQNKKPQCRGRSGIRDGCNGVLKYIFHNDIIGTKKIGYICPKCNLIYIQRKYTAVYYNGGFDE